MKIAYLKAIILIGLVTYFSAFLENQNAADKTEKTTLEREQQEAQEKANQNKDKAKTSSENKEANKSVESELSSVAQSTADFNNEIAKLTDSSDFGSAVITFIRNNTAYPMSISIGSEKNELLDQIPEDSIVRIKSLKSSFGERGKYYSVNKINDSNVLKADCDDALSAKTDFLVKKYKSTSFKKSFLGLVLPDNKSNYLIADKSNKVQFGPASGGFYREEGVNAQWTIQGSRLDVCYLKNRLTDGLLGPISDDSEQSKDVTFPPQTNLITWKGVSGRSGKLELADLESGLKEKENLSISQLVWRANKARQHYISSSLENQDAQRIMNSYLEQAKLERGNFASGREHEQIFYGDRIKISHTMTMQSLYAQAASNSGPDADIVFCSNGDDQDQVDDQLACWWIIKGPHHPTDRLNCQIGAPVKMGDVIRLENVKSGKNLSAKKLSKDFGTTFKKESVPDDYEQVQVFTAGVQGIGSDEDNWIISALDGSGQDFWKAREVFFVNAMSSCKLHSINSFFKTNEKTPFLQKVLALKQKQLQGAPNQELDSGKANALLGKIPTSNTLIEQPKGQSSQKGVVSKVSDKELESIKKTSKQADALVQEESKKRTPAPEPELILNSRGWFVSSVFRFKAPKNNVAWTGFENGAIFEDDPDQRIAIEIVKLGFDSAIKSGETLSQTFNLEYDRPSISGFATQKIDEVERDTLLVLPPMLGKGIAWFNKPFDEPGQFSVSFLGRSVEDGRLEIFLGQTTDLSWVYKVVIGSGGGSKTSIFKNVFNDGKFQEQEVFSVDKKENLLAGLNSGKFLPYWISCNQGSICHGVGMIPGKNIVASWTDPNPSSNLSRVGFGSFKAESQYTGFLFGKSVKIEAPERFFAKVDNSFDLSEGQGRSLDQGLQVPGVGSISFSAQGTGQFMLVLSKTKEPGGQQYALNFDSENGSCQVLEWDLSKGVYQKRFDTGRQDGFMFNAGRRTFWISFDDEQLLVGSGDQFGTLSLTGVKNRDLAEFLNMNFVCKKGSVNVSGIKIGSPVQLSKADQTIDFKSPSSEGPTKNFVSLICPFDYLLNQTGPSIVFKDQILGTSQFLGKALAKGSRYEFIVAINPDGFPQMTWTREPENAAQLRIRVLGKALRGAGQSLFLAASQMESTGKMSPDDIKDGKMDPGSALAAASSFATTGVGAALARGGIELEAMANYDYEKSLKTEVATDKGPKPYSKQSPDAGFVYQEKANQRQKVETGVPWLAQENKMRLDEQMAMGQKWIASTPEKLTQLLPLYKQVIGLINHPYVVKNEPTKKAVIENLESLYKAQDEFFGKSDKINLTFGVLMDLLLTAYFNPYLIDVDDPENNSVRQTWLARVSNLADKMLALDGYLELPALENTQIWLSKTLSEKNKGTVEFQAKGQGDLIVSLFPEIANDKFKVDGYKVIFGANDNKTIQIRVGDFISPVAKIDVGGDVLNQVVSRKFWISLDGGKISVGKDDQGEKNKILEWTDPYQNAQVNRIGLSTKNTPVTIEGFAVR